MSHYNWLTDEIDGAEPGTLVYRHELGHRWLQHHLRFYIWAGWVDDAFILLTLWALAQGSPGDWLAARGIIVLLLCFRAFDELFAWGFALIISVKNRVRPQSKADF